MAMAPPGVGGGFSSFLGPVGTAIDVVGSVAGLFGGKKQKVSHAFDQMLYQHELNKTMAQNAVQWRVEDAKKAGVHPLAALGTPLATNSPVAVGYPSESDSFGDKMASMGQNVSRAMRAAMPQEGREVLDRVEALRLENMGLQNDLLRSQIATVNRDLNPPAPSGGMTKDVALQRVVSAPGRPHMEPGSVTDVGYSRTPTGLFPVPSKDVKERIEDAMIPETIWAARNYVFPRGKAPDPKLYPLPKGYDYWKWDQGSLEYRPAKRKPAYRDDGRWKVREEGGVLKFY